MSMYVKAHGTHAILAPANEFRLYKYYFFLLTYYPSAFYYAMLVKMLASANFLSQLTCT